MRVPGEAAVGVPPELLHPPIDQGAIEGREGSFVSFEEGERDGAPRAFMRFMRKRPGTIFIERRAMDP